MGMCKKHIVFLIVLKILFLFLTQNLIAQTQRPPAPYNKKPKKPGIYLLRSNKFIPLSSHSISVVNHSYRTSSAGRGLKAMYINLDEQKLKNIIEYSLDDLLVIYSPGSTPTHFYKTPLTLHPDFTIMGKNHSQIKKFPFGWYCGLIGLGDGKKTSLKYKSSSAKYYNRDYHFESGKLKRGDILFRNKDIIFAKITPLNPLPNKYYILTKENFYHNYNSLDEEMKQLPRKGFLLKFKHKEYFIEDAKEKEIIRSNEENAPIYLLAEKNVTLDKNTIVDTGITNFTDSAIRFLSERNFRIVSDSNRRPWDLNGFSALHSDFRNKYKKIPDTNLQANRVDMRDFTLGYDGSKFRKWSDKPKIQLQGIKGGTNVKIIYSPLFCYDKLYYEHIKTGYNFIKNKEYKYAIEYFNKALTAIPNYDKAINYLCWLYATAENEAFYNPKKALEYALLLKRIKPIKSTSLNTIAKAYFVNGDLTNAIKYEEQAYRNWQDKPDNYRKNMALFNKIKGHLHMASEHFEDEVYEDTLSELNNALKEMPNCFRALNLIAWTYINAEDDSIIDVKKGLEYAKKAYELAPQKSFIIDTLAEAYLANDDRKNAYQYGLKAVFYNPSDNRYIKKLSKYK